MDRNEFLRLLREDQAVRDAVFRIVGGRLSDMCVRTIQVDDGPQPRVLAGDNTKSGEFVPFDPPLAGLDGLAFCDHDMQPGDTAKTVEKGPSGFLRQYFNAAGEPVARTFDWVAKESLAA